MIACCVVIIVTLITPFLQVVSPLGKRMPGWFRNFLTCRVGSYTNVDRLGCPRSYFTYHIAQGGYYSVMKWILRFHFVWMRIRAKHFIFADPDSGSQNVADPMDPDTKHCLKVFKKVNRHFHSFKYILQ